MQQYSDSDLQYWVDMIQVSGQNVTKWEEEFVNDMENKLAKHRGLSSKEIQILDQIYTNRVP